MTDRLYYRNSALLTFEAEIVDTGAFENRFYTVLDRSAFYPTSGGQLFDTGTLNEIAVIDVIESEDKEVLHITEVPVGKEGDTVTGKVDKQRRLKNRQVHTAQHILSQAFIKVCGAETVSVHLGEEYATIELNAADISDDNLLKTEKLANEVVEDNLPVDIIFADDELLKYLPIRKIPEREGELRVIKIGDFECSACGGTHCNRTAEVGFIKIVGTEKIRGHVQIKFLAGNLALMDYMNRFMVTNRLSKAFTCHVNDLPDKIEKLTQDYKTAQKKITQLQKELLPARAELLAGEAKMAGKVKACCRIISDLDNNAVNFLTALVADKIKGLALFMTGERLFLAVADKTPFDAGELMKQLALQMQLKGGGSRKAAQAGGIEPDKFEEYKDFILKLVNE